MTGKADAAAIQTFRRNIRSVHELMRFDDMVLEFVIGPLEKLAERQTTAKINNPRHRVDSVLATVKGIQRNASLRPHYSAMYNQCLVLVVSYFASASRSLFIDSVVAAIDSGASSDLLDSEVRLTPRDIHSAAGNPAQLIAEALADAKEMSFQDMQSVDRAFRKFFGSAPEKGQMINDIIVGQACRHSIVHAGALVSRRLLTQVRAATPRTLKQSLTDGELIEFSREEVTHVAKEMLQFLRATAELVEASGVRLPRRADV